MKRLCHKQFVLEELLHFSKLSTHFRIGSLQGNHSRTTLLELLWLSFIWSYILILKTRLNTYFRLQSETDSAKTKKGLKGKPKTLLKIKKKHQTTTSSFEHIPSRWVRTKCNMYVAVFFTHNICIILRHEDLKKNCKHLPPFGRYQQVCCTIYKASQGNQNCLIYMSEQAGAHVTLHNGTDITYHTFIVH